MFKHYLIFLEKDELKEKIAFHKIIKTQKDFEIIKDYEEKLKQSDIDVYTHLVTTKCEQTESLAEKDHFFEDTIYFEDFDTFLSVAQSKK